MNLQPVIPMSQTHQIILGYLGFYVAVSSPTPADLQWLQEALAPAFCVNAGATPDLDVNVVVDQQVHAHLRSAGPLDGRHAVPFFGFDGHSADFQSWSGGKPRVYDQELDFFYALTDSAGRIEILARHWKPSIRIALLRLLRELVTQRLSGQSYIHMHAAAFESQGRGFLICGPRRAGKTSLLLHLLGPDTTRYLANDRAVIYPDTSDGMRISGMPTVVSIRKRTLGLFADLGLEGMRHWLARMTLDEALASPIPDDLTKHPEALSLSPAHLCHWLQVSASAQASMSGVLFPVVRVNTTGIHMNRLSTNETRDRLAESVMPPCTSLLHEWLGERLTNGRNHKADVHSWPTVPAYRCILGRDAFSNPARADRLLSYLVEDVTR